jgi:hypothetical protein
MKFCEECGDKIGILRGYNHPVFGKKSLVCGDCFSSIDESLTLWRDFVLSNSFNKGNSELKFNLNVLRNFSPSF